LFGSSFIFFSLSHYILFILSVTAQVPFLKKGKIHYI